jgi:hypothetical protein
VDLVSLFKDVASEYVQMCTEASQIRQLVEGAAAMGTRTA